MKRRLLISSLALFSFFPRRLLTLCVLFVGRHEHALSGEKTLINWSGTKTQNLRSSSLRGQLQSWPGHQARKTRQEACQPEFAWPASCREQSMATGRWVLQRHRAQSCCAWSMSRQAHMPQTPSALTALSSAAQWAVPRQATGERSWRTRWRRQFVGGNSRVVSSSRTTDPGTVAFGILLLYPSGISSRKDLIAAFQLRCEWPMMLQVLLPVRFKSQSMILSSRTMKEEDVWLCPFYGDRHWGGMCSPYLYS